LEILLFLSERAAKISVSPPTLPKNIKSIRIHLEIIPNVGVMPRVKPTVPIAEAVSKAQVLKGIPSIVLIITAPLKNRIIYIIIIVAAFLITFKSTLLPNILVSLFLRKVDSIVTNKTATVVVFIPPAVEPGEPPISIIKMLIAFPAPVILVISAVLNPAVRKVMD
jgi:hypothetical protein